MKFSIITANLNMLPYLKLCHASIMDQGVDLEHIVIDGISKDGSVEWLDKKMILIVLLGKIIVCMKL